MAKKLAKKQKEEKIREKLVTELMTCTPSASAGIAIRAIHGDSDKYIGDGEVISGYSALCISELIIKQQKLLDKGNLSSLETMLLSQAYTLNAISTSMTQKMANAEYVKNLEVYARIALKAQNQTRMTISTLAEIKGVKKTTFVHQVNNAHNQQINNNGAGENSRNSANERVYDDVDTRGATRSTQEDSGDEAMALPENTTGESTLSSECNEARTKV